MLVSDGFEFEGDFYYVLFLPHSPILEPNLILLVPTYFLSPAVPYCALSAGTRHAFNALLYSLYKSVQYRAPNGLTFKYLLILDFTESSTLFYTFVLHMHAM